MIEFRVNGRHVAVDGPDDMPLLWALREVVGLTGTKFGCGIGECGACTVHVDGEPERSCIVTIAQVGNKSVRTIEGIANDAVGARVRRAWLDLNVIQCGYCQPGQIMSATALLSSTAKPSDAEIDDAMSGNICRCGTYPRIRAAIHRAATS